MEDSSQHKLVAIYGPTAVGKSRVALEVASAIDGEIISADSMQIYRGLPIITDQPAPEMLSQVPHHFIATVPLTEDYSAALYAREAKDLISDIGSRGCLPLLVGGTGLYIRALLGGFSFAPAAAADIRIKWEEFLELEGTAAAFAELERLDPETAAVIDRDNPRRLIRALEAAQPVTGTAAAADARPRERDRLWAAESPYRMLSFGLEMPRQELYARIEARVDEMLASGAVEEVRAALQAEVSRTAAQAIGFQELKSYLQGGSTLEEAAAAIKQKTRRYAKRQLTWMRKMPDVARIDMAVRTPEQAVQEILSRIRQAGFIS